MHYVPIASSGYIEYTTSLYKVQGRMHTLRNYTMFQGRITALYPYTMFRIEWMHYVPIASSGYNECTTSL